MEDRLDKINQKVNSLIGRLTMYRQLNPILTECHTLSLEIGADIDELINEL